MTPVAYLKIGKWLSNEIPARAIDLSLNAYGRSLYFAGIDLSWRMTPPRDKGTGACLVDETGRLRELTLLTYDDEILRFVRSRGEVWVGIDASLVVPEGTSLRKCERQVLDRGIKIFPTNRIFYQAHYGGCRGEQIQKILRSQGFGCSDQGAHDRLYEVYPRATLFTMCRGKVPSYKKGPTEPRKEAMLEVVRILERTEPSLRLGEEIVRGDPCVWKGEHERSHGHDRFIIERGHGLPALEI